MRKRLLFLEIALILSLVIDYITHYLPLTMANVIFFIALSLALYLFKPYFIWTDLIKRRKENQGKHKDSIPH